MALNVCQKSSLFSHTNSVHTKHIKRAIADTLGVTKVEKSKQNDLIVYKGLFNPEEFVRTIAERCIDSEHEGCQFLRMRYDTSVYKGNLAQKLYNAAVNDLTKYILQVVGDLKIKGSKDAKTKAIYDSINMDELRLAIVEHFYKALGLQSNHSGLELPNIEEMVFRAPLGVESYRRAKLHFFGTASDGAGRYNYQRFVKDIFQRSIVDFKSGRIISNTVQLNEQIADYKNQLFSNIVSFLESYGRINTYPSMFSEDGELQYISYLEVMSTMQEIVNEMKESQLLENSLLDGYFDALSGASNPMFSALNSYFTLLYFDDLIEEGMGRLIKINGNKGEEADVDFNKYSFSRDLQHLRKNWNEDGDLRTAIDNTSKYTKLVLQAIPMKSSLAGLPQFVGPVKFTTAITKLFSHAYLFEFDDNTDLGIQSNSSPEHKLAYYISKFHSNPTEYATRLFEVLNEEKTIKFLRSLVEEGTVNDRNYRNSKPLFTNTDFEVFEAMYNYVFAFNSEDLDEFDFSDYQTKSIKAITERDNLVNYAPESRYSIVDDIAGMMNDVMDLTYVEVLYDNQGNPLVKIRSKFRDEDLVYRSASRINYNVSMATETIRKLWLLDTNTTLTGLGKATITIPGTDYTYTVELKGKGNKGGLLGVTNNYSLTIDDPDANRVLYSLGSSAVDLMDFDTLTKILSPDTLNNKIIYNTLKFLEDRLGIDLCSRDGLTKLAIIKDLSPEHFNSFLEELLYTTARIQVLTLLRLDFNDALASGNTSYKTERDFLKYLDSRFTASEHIFLNRDAVLSMVDRRDGFNRFQIVSRGTSDGWLTKYIDALLILVLEDAKSTSKNLEGNNDANYSTSFLGGNLRHNLHLYRSAQRTLLGKIAEQLEAIDKQYIYDAGVDKAQLEPAINRVNTYFDPQILNLQDEIKKIKLKDGVNAVEKDLSQTKKSDINKIRAQIRDLVKRKDKAIKELKVKGMDSETRAAYEQAIERVHKMNMEHTATDSLFFTDARRQGFIWRTIVNSGARNKFNDVKLSKNLNISELFYGDIVHNFCLYYVDNNAILVQPTTYADKVKDIQYEIKLRKSYKSDSIDGVKLLHMNSELYQLVYWETIGKAYLNTFNNVIVKYRNLFNGEVIGGELIDGVNINTVEDVNKLLKHFTKDNLIALAQSKGLTLFEETDYRDTPKGLRFNETLAHLAMVTYKDVESTRNFLKELQVYFIKDLNSAGVNFYCDVDISESDSDDVIVSKLRKSKNPIVLAYMKMCKNYNIEDEDDMDLESNLKVAQIADFGRKWIRNGKIILAKNNGEAITYSSDKFDNLELNPLIEKYFYMSSILGNNLRYTLTGSEIAHPDKSFIDKALELINAGIIKDSKLVKGLSKLKGGAFIWAHSGSGKTSLIKTEYAGSIIDFDTEYKEKEILEAMEHKFRGFEQLVEADFNSQNPDSKSLSAALIRVANSNTTYETEYKVLFKKALESARQRAKDEGKILLVSDHSILRNYADELDAVFTLSKESFMSRRSDNSEGWWNSLNNTLQFISADKKYDMEDLYMSDMLEFAAWDLYKMSQNKDPKDPKNAKKRNLANTVLLKILNVAQGTLLKRNVIIPATLHYINTNNRFGVPLTTKMAIINDIPAEVWDFIGNVKGNLESMDGSAVQNPFLSRFENKSLGSLEVGSDKKPIWHSYDPYSMTATLVKFAVFEMSNARIRQSLNSTTLLMNLMRKTTNMLWQNLETKEWNTKAFGQALEIDLCGNSGYNSVELGTNKSEISKLTLEKVLKGKSVYYRTADSRYREILGLERDSNGAYYTLEYDVRSNGAYIGAGRDPKKVIRVYQLFDKNSDLVNIEVNNTQANKYEEEGRNVLQIALDNEFGQLGTQLLHTINSLFELWKTFGAYDSLEIKNGELQFSESSNDFVVDYMNAVSFRKPGLKDPSNKTLDGYAQPLKTMMIGYVANSTAVKNGYGNVNSNSRWYDNEALTYIELDNAGLGIQMDADHEANSSEMTEFSLVITALEAGGRTHLLSKFIYRTLGEIAYNSSSNELDTITEILQNKDLTKGQVKSKLYDVIGRVLIDHVKLNGDRASLTDVLIQKLEREFNKTFNDHERDLIKIPFSDPNIYSQILPTFISNINNKSIKRKYKGGGCVMVPGYSIMLIFKYRDADGNMVTSMVDDIYELALEYGDDNDLSDEWYLNDDGTETKDNTRKKLNLIRHYLEFIQKQQDSYTIAGTAADPTKETLSFGSFIPTDIIDVRDIEGNALATVNLSKILDYYAYLDDPRLFILNLIAKAKGIKIDTQFDLGQEILDVPGSYTLKVGTDGLITDGAFNSILAKLGINGMVLRQSAIAPRDLAPAQITWKFNGIDMNIFALKEFRDCFKYTKLLKEAKTNLEKQAILDLLNKARKDVQYQFDLIALNKFRDANGVIQNIDLGSLNNKAAEIIISNMYADLLGLLGYSIDYIEKHKDYLFKLNPRPIVPKADYDLIFRKQNGKDTYITFDKIGDEDTNYIKYQPYKTSQIIYKESGVEGNKTIKAVLLDKEGKEVMTVGRCLDVSKKYQWNSQLNLFTYLDDPTKTVESKIAKNLRRDGNRVYKYLEYVSKYEVARKVGNVIQKDTVYKINLPNLFKTMQPSSATIGGERVVSKNISRKDKMRALSSILDDLFVLDSYVGIELASQMSAGTAGNLADSLGGMTLVDDDFKEGVINPLVQILNKYRPVIDKTALEESEKDITGSDEDTDLVDLSKEKLAKKLLIKDANAKLLTIDVKDFDAINALLKSYYTKVGEARYNSWKRTLYYTVARIPAQSHQSFMLMKAVAYTGSDKNVCHVSHWQTWLQGSDYDIDKAYVMACTLGGDGKFVKWSNLFDYSTDETLQASLTLPTVVPFLISGGSYKSYHGDNVFNLDSYIAKYINTGNYSHDKAHNLRLIGDILRDTLDYLDKLKDSTGVTYTYSTENEDIAKEIIQQIGIHNHTKLKDRLLDDAYKNYVSSNILQVILNPRNMISAYTPISMADLRKASDNSPKGNQVVYMNLTNPATKWIMQYQNMTGKLVIGITAVGEKVYFNGSYYWNEGMRSGNQEWIKHLKFKQTIDGIKGRNSGNPLSVTVETLAGINIENCDEALDSIISGALKVNYLLEHKYQLFTVEDVENYEKGIIDDFTSELLDALYDLHNEVLNFSEYEELLSTGINPDIIISQLLSAATDNAKELILAKINCDTDFAKCYLQLVMMGFDIKDVVAYMTSSAVENIASAMKFNMFDPRLNTLNLSLATRIAEGYLPVSAFVSGTSQIVYTDEDSYELEENFNSDSDGTVRNDKKLLDKVSNTILFSDLDDSTVESAFAKLVNEKLKQIKTLKESESDDKSYTLTLQDYLQAYILTKALFSNAIPELSSLIGVLNSDEQALLDYAEYITYKIKLTLKPGYSLNDYLKDVELFKHILFLADETSSLGNTFLGLNLGLPTDKEGLISKLNGIENIIRNAETDKKVKKSIAYAHNNDANADEIKKKTENFNALVDSILNLGVETDRKLIEDTLRLAIAYNIVGNFDANKWIMDVSLDLGSLKFANIGGVEYNANSTTYREVTKNYYNLIKGCWSVFHMMENIPLFESIIKLLLAEYMFDSEISIKGKLQNAINRDLRDHKHPVKAENLSKLVSYSDKLIFAKFFDDNPFIIKVPKGSQIFSKFGLVITTDVDGQSIDLSTLEGRASFKMLMEDEIIPSLKSGKWFGFNLDPDTKFNLLRDLYVSRDEKGSSLTVDIDLTNPFGTDSSSRKFTQYQLELQELHTVKNDLGYSITDFLMLYNFIANQNKYGRDRLTSLFKNFVLSNENNILTQYNLWLGDFDFDSDSDSILDQFNYSMEDALIETAETVNQNKLYLYGLGSVVRTKDDKTGRYIYKKKIMKNWLELDLYPSKTLVSGMDDTSYMLFKTHWTMLLPSYWKQNTLRDAFIYRNITEADPEGQLGAKLDILTALRLYVKKGVINVLKNCS